MVFKLAHLSDIHLGPLPEVKRHELLSKRVVGYTNWRLNRSGKMNDGILDSLVTHMKSAQPDHIAVTGDLVNLALQAELVLAAAWLKTLGDADDVSAVPGNHDTYVPSALERIKDLWRPFMTGDTERNDDLMFPFRRDRGPVAIIGTNSGRASMPFLATGSFKSQQRDETAQLLRAAKEDGLFRVVLIHHPPFKDATIWSKRLIGSGRFRDMIAETGAELVLHGHTHIVSMETIEGADGNVPVIGVPSASAAPRDTAIPREEKPSRPGARYNLFSISGHVGGWQCEMDEFGYKDGETEVSHIASHTLHG